MVGRPGFEPGLLASQARVLGLYTNIHVNKYTMCIPYTRGSARFGARYRCIGRGKPTHLSTTLRMYRMDSNHRPARLSPHSSIQLSYRTYCFSHVDWTRTSDWHIISLLLYQLSYYACFLHVNWGRTNTIGLWVRVLPVEVPHAISSTFKMVLPI